MYHAASVPHLGQPSTEQNEVGERENEVMDTGGCLDFRSLQILGQFFDAFKIQEFI